MARSKGAGARRRRQVEEKVALDTPPEREAAPMETMFKEGELLTRHEIEERIRHSGRVRFSDEEFFRLVKARVFKQYKGKYRVRGS